METKIKWETKFDKALTRATEESKPIILDFFNPG